MTEEAVLPIREFSLLTGISRETLRFYDKVGLLSPEKRQKNNYRYYSARQLDFAYLISELRALGMGLEEIKRYAEARTPERMLTLFREQSTHIETEIKRLRSIQTVMRMRAEAAKDALLREERTVQLEEREREPIFLCPRCSGGNIEQELYLQGYRYAADCGVNISYPFGVVRKRDEMNSGNPPTPSQLYFKVPSNHNAWKSAGTYAVYLYRPIDRSSSELYLPFLSMLKEKGLRMVGDTYEEYPLDELSTHRREDYRVRLEVQVAEV